MEWLVRQFKEILVISLRGELDAVATPQLEEFLVSKINGGNRKLILNFRDVSYMSSAGIRLLLSIFRTLEAEGGRLSICCVHEHVSEVIRMAGVQHLLPVCKSEQDSFSQF